MFRLEMETNGITVIFNEGVEVNGFAVTLPAGFDLSEANIQMIARTVYHTRHFFLEISSRIQEAEGDNAIQSGE